MKLFDPHATPLPLRERLSSDEGRRVACYCAAWCRTCDAWRPLLESLADEYPGWTFLWVDVEDSPDWLGDEDIENFPTILVQDRAGTRYWGALQPRAEQLRRLIEGATELPVLPGGPGDLDTLAGDTLG